LERIFEKDELGRFLPLTIVGNYYLNQNGWINFKGERVRIIDEPLAPEFNPKNPHVDITKFRVRKKRATLKFNYKNHSIFIQLKRNGNRWEYHKLKAKKGNEKVVDINF